jgi:hypothetical protein
LVDAGWRRMLLDGELAVLYEVTTRRLNEQVRRRHPLALAKHGAIQAATTRTGKFCCQRARASSSRTIFLTCSAVIGFSAVPKCCPSASLMSV